jgi:hypothetical protein
MGDEDPPRQLSSLSLGLDMYSSQKGRIHPLRRGATPLIQIKTHPLDVQPVS